MDNLLVPACIVLFLTTMSALWQAWFWRKQAKASEHAAMGMALDLSRASRASHDAAWDACKRHMLGVLYRVVARAEREGRDPFAALREVAVQADETPVVQVPESV